MSPASLVSVWAVTFIIITPSLRTAWNSICSVHGGWLQTHPSLTTNSRDYSLFHPLHSILRRFLPYYLYLAFITPSYYGITVWTLHNPANISRERETNSNTLIIVHSEIFFISKYKIMLISSNLYKSWCERTITFLCDYNDYAGMKVTVTSLWIWQYLKIFSSLSLLICS